MPDDDLAASPPADTVGLLEGLTSTRAIRRYLDEPVPPEALRAMFFAAHPRSEWIEPPALPLHRPHRRSQGEARPRSSSPPAPRRSGPASAPTTATTAGSGSVENSPKARMAATMQRYIDDFERVPVLVLPCLVRYREPTPFEGASIFPAMQNLLLAARALGYGGVLDRLPTARRGPSCASCSHVARGRVHGRHDHHRQARGQPRPGPPPPARRADLRRRVGGVTPTWAVDPVGTQHTQAGPPKSGCDLTSRPPVTVPRWPTTRDVLLVEEHGAVRLLTLNRPDALQRHQRDAARRARQRVAEPRRRHRDASAGHHRRRSGVLRWRRPQPARSHGARHRPARRDHGGGRGRSCAGMTSIEVPIIAAVNGPAVGLGCSLAGLSDIVLDRGAGLLLRPARRARARRRRRRRDDVAAAHQPAPRQGVHPARRPRARPRTRCASVWPTASCPPAPSVEQALQLGERIAKLPPQSVRETKRLLNRP